MFSETVHIGHTLNATIFGPLNEPKSYHLLKSSIGHLLNFYRSFKPNSAASWVRNEQRRADGLEILPPVPLFEFNPSIPIQEIIAASTLGSTRTKGRSLYARLAKLPHEARQEEIDRLEAEYRKQEYQKSGITLVDTLETVASPLLGCFSLLLTPVVKKGVKKGRHIPQIDQMIEQLKSTFNVGGNQELDFLSRISRVATFRRERI